MEDRDLLRIVDGLESPRVLIIGDLILDRYVTGEVRRISPEAPIPVLAARHEELRLGGAGNVAANLRSMEAEVEILGVVGDDARGEKLLELLGAIGVDVTGVRRSGERPTTEKTRLVGAGQQILRVDWEAARPLSEATEAAVLDGIVVRVARAGVVILSDYGKGVLTNELIARVIEIAREAAVPVLVDPKGTDYTRYLGASLITPNKKEAEEALGRPITDLEELPDACQELMSIAGLDAVVVTLGADGIYFRADGVLGESAGRIPATARAVFDVTGAGDTVIALLALGLAAALRLEEAVSLANHAASIVVGRRGTATVTRQELRAVLGERRRGSGAILHSDELAAQLAEWRSEGKRIVFTNGCFDVLHAGHVDYLRTARSRGDALIVGVNDDASVRRLKGEGRPINDLDDRLCVLAALEMVDAVIAFPEDTPGRIIEDITPDVLVKGKDWETKGVVGREWVEGHGGEVFLAPLLPGRSTTAIVDRLRDA